ncbi:MAG: aminotransferase class V-fold PLP-dependent enzyme [Candidatus Wallbacteria bacterium]|nr:aminotransferase class V-fold PLP-dependent enzyme [Candidatus Wallbacteria bacterium]
MIFRRKVYLDYNATTPLDPQVKKAVRESLDCFGNPSSLHATGRMSRSLMEEARVHVSRLINASPEQVLFTSGGSEANNAVIKGIAAAMPGKIITSQFEHASIFDTCKFLERRGTEVVFLAPDRDGIIRPEALEAVITNDTALVSVMTVNNEIGTIQDIARLVEIAHSHGALFHTDAVQAVGKIQVDVRKTGVDFLTFSAHKIHGPKGCGALYIRNRRQFTPLLHGGHQESLLRGGTENFSGIIGFGEACRIVSENSLADIPRQKALSAYFLRNIRKFHPAATLNGSARERVPGTMNIRFPGFDNRKLLSLLDYYGISVSMGSACSEGKKDISHVLTAIGLSEDEARSSLRFSLGKYTTPDELKYCLKRLKKILQEDNTETTLLSPVALDETILINSDYYIVDLRYGFQRALSGMLPMADKADIFKLEEESARFPRDRKIVLLCEYGADAYRSSFLLRKLGFSEVVVLAGGFASWIAAHPFLYKKYVMEGRTMKLVNRRHEDQARYYDIGMKLHWLWKYKKFRQALLDNLPGLSGGTLLDYGCGTGLMLEYILANSDFSGTYIGCDPGFGMLEVAVGKKIKHKLMAFVQVAETPELPVRDSSIDAIVLSLVTHQISREGKLKLFNEFFRVLKPGGMVSIAEFGKPVGISGKISAWYIRKLWGNILTGVEFNSRDNFAGKIPVFLEKSGFRDVRITGSFSGMIDIIAARKPAV